MLLRDRVRPPVKVLFVGINPGIRSAAIGHHFAGYSNRFWKLLFDAGLVPELIGPEDDGRLPEWGFGLTNLVPRPTPGIDSLTPQEYVDGERVLRRKVRRWKPHVVAFVGITLYRAVFEKGTGVISQARAKRGSKKGTGVVLDRRTRQEKGADVLLGGSGRMTPVPFFPCGLQPERFEGACVFVLPNPSGRNANFSYPQMLAAFKLLARVVRL
jgi:TDG/mug DNA glycosylase family protein